MIYAHTLVSYQKSDAEKKRKKKNSDRHNRFR